VGCLGLNLVFIERVHHDIPLKIFLSEQTYLSEKIALELALVLLTVGRLKLTSAVHHSAAEVSLVDVALVPLVNTLTLFHVHLVGALVD